MSETPRYRCPACGHDDPNRWVRCFEDDCPGGPDRTPAPKPAPKPARTYSQADVIALLRVEIGRIGTQRAYANYLGVSVAFLNKVLAGKAKPSPKLLAPFGLRPVKTTVYVAAERL